MSQQEKPREFWLYFNCTPCGDNKFFDKRWDLLDKSFYIDYKETHVIEFSAYEALKSENEKLRSENEKMLNLVNDGEVMSRGLHESRMANVESQLTAEREASKRLVECIEKITTAKIHDDAVRSFQGLIIFAQRTLEQYKKARGE